MKKYIAAYKHEYNSINDTYGKFMAKPYNKLKHRLAAIYAIDKGTQLYGLRISRNPTNKRLDSNLTNLAKDLKPFIIGMNNMVSIDLVNSQPFLFNIIINRFKNKINYRNKALAEFDIFYKKTKNGIWYEYLAHEFDISRDDAKELWMNLAYSKNASYQIEKLLFKKKFPTIAKIIYDTKKKVTQEWLYDYSELTSIEADKNTKRPHRKLSVELQRIESEIFIDEIAHRLIEEGIYPYTIHDSVIVPKDDKDKTIEVMEEVFMDKLGGVPKFHIEYLLN